jgi:hypothetical protein
VKKGQVESKRVRKPNTKRPGQTLTVCQRRKKVIVVRIASVFFTSRKQRLFRMAPLRTNVKPRKAMPPRQRMKRSMKTILKEGTNENERDWDVINSRNESCQRQTRVYRGSSLLSKVLTTRRLCFCGLILDDTLIRRLPLGQMIDCAAVAAAPCQICHTANARI